MSGNQVSRISPAASRIAAAVREEPSRRRSHWCATPSLLTFPRWWSSPMASSSESRRRGSLQRRCRRSYPR